MYRYELRSQIYEELLRQGCRVLDDGRSVILDGTFLTRELRRRAYDLGRRHDAAVINVLCECPQETALARIEERAKRGDSKSEARVDLYDAQVQGFQAPIDEALTIRVHTTFDLSDQITVVCDALRNQLFSTS
jgi:predicted kinase